MTNERTIDENWKAAFWKQNEEAANRLLGPARAEAWGEPMPVMETPDDRIKRDWSPE